MTTVVGYKYENKVYMGADSLASCPDGFSELRADPKLFKTGDYLIGFSGSYRIGQLLMYNTNFPTAPKSDKNIFKFMSTKFIDAVVESLEDRGALKDKSPDRILETEATFLVAIRGNLFAILEDFQVADNSEPYSSIGSGASIALGAMSILETLEMPPEEKVNRALQSAARHNVFTRSPFTVTSSV
jgi:ATP-dependent protease HslVU (ClpYQ) peptidase subunit